MTYVNRQGYLERRGKGVPSGIVRNWWLVKYDETPSEHHKEYAAVIKLGNVRVPKDVIGKKIRFKIEVLPDWHMENG